MKNNKGMYKNKTDMKLSIILPVYNVSQYLEFSLGSLIKQELKEIEIICVNDGSTDNSLEILEEFQKKDDRIIIINQKNQGAGIARNNGMKIATGEYIGFLDPDDYYYDENALSYLYSGARKFNSFMCGGNFQIICDNNFENLSDSDKTIKQQEKSYKDLTNFVFKEEKLGQTEDYKSTGWFWRFIYNRDFLKKNNITFPDYENMEDIPFLAKSISLTNNIYFIRDITYCYRIRKETRRRCNPIQKNHTFLALRECFDIYHKYNKNIQYSDVITILVEMIDVFSYDIINNIEINNDIKQIINYIINNIDLQRVNPSHFWRKDIKSMKNILTKENYEKLIGIGNRNVFY